MHELSKSKKKHLYDGISARTSFSNTNIENETRVALFIQ